MIPPVILGVDPGNVETGFALYDPESHAVLEAGVVPNRKMLAYLMTRLDPRVTVATEMMRARGMPTSNEEMETLVWIGRFQQAWHAPEEVMKVFRGDVKLFICGKANAKDSNVRQGIIEMFPRTGGGKVKQVGTAKQPGPLFGVTSHAWPALGVALTACHQMETPKRRVKL